MICAERRRIRLTVEGAVRADGHEEHGKVASADVGQRQRYGEDVADHGEDHWDGDVQGALVQASRRPRDEDGCKEGEEVGRSRHEQGLVRPEAEGGDDGREEVREGLDTGNEQLLERQ